MTVNDVGPDGLNDRTDADERVVEIDDEDLDVVDDDDLDDTEPDVDEGPLGGGA